MIKINDKIYIRNDDYNWVVCKKAVSKKGKNKGRAYMKDLTYHPSLEQAVMSLNEHMTRAEFKEKETTINRALKTFKDIKNDLVKALKEIEYEDEKTVLTAND